MKGNIVFISMAVAVSCLVMSSCGLNKTSTVTLQLDTRITSNPSGAQVECNGEKIGTTPCMVKLPVRVTVTRMPDMTMKTENWEIQFSKDGVVETVFINPDVLKTEGEVYLLHYTFKQAPYMHDPTIMAGEANNMVSRDAPGETALERTIIRWYFDSDPRGARVFWRVVSSIPHVVKNTNEQYLGTTPFEETRSFNILGLTYENSRDVQVEVKVTRDGYMDQVKRFNVRQAIDQQEISSFFDLVEDE